MPACIAVLDQALRSEPGLVSALVARAGLLSTVRLLLPSLEDYDRALSLEPNQARTHHHRAEVLLKLKRPEEAAQAFRQALALGGDEAELRYALASLDAAETPDSAPSSYVVTLFDWYAQRFDKHLLEQLQYQTPALLCKQVLDLAPGHGLDVVDLGCGTGLCGPHVRASAKRLTGVDLSPNMLAVAAERGVYDDLICSDLTGFLADKSDCFDLALASDVFIYVGALESVFAACQRALRHGGLFAFSCEVSEERELVLRPTRRYAHSVAYVQRLAAQFGFDVLRLEASVIRQEGGEALRGYLAVLQARH